MELIMKKEEIDKLITESLNKEESEFYRLLKEEGVFKMWGNLYTGKHGWIAAVHSVFITIFVGIAIYCGYKFFYAEVTADMLRYGAGMFIAMMFTAFLKLWLWMQMDKNSILREMKRLEFQIAVLMEKLPDKK